MSIAESDVAFFTALVGDFKSNSGPYLGFIATGGVAVPTAIMKYAPQFKTITDDSYTTLLTNSDVNISELRSFASELPWYSRIVAEEGATATGDSPATTTDGSSATGAASQPSETGSAADSGSVASSIASNLSSRASAATAAAASAAAAAGSSSAAGSVIYAPMGIVALAGLALL